jgi:hypothetical protein
MEAKDFQKKVEGEISVFNIKLERINDFVCTKFINKIYIGETIEASYRYIWIDWQKDGIAQGIAEIWTCWQSWIGQPWR